LVACSARASVATPPPQIITVVVAEPARALPQVQVTVVVTEIVREPAQVITVVQTVPPQVVTVIATPTPGPAATVRPPDPPAQPLPPVPPGGGRLPPPGNAIGSCNADRCLSTDPTFLELPAGLATLRGHYASIEREAFGQKKACDVMVVIDDAANPLIEAFRSLVRKGNTLNSVNAQGRLELTLALAALSPADQARVRASTPAQPVALTVLRPIRAGTSVPVCTSFVEVLRVQ
jgi:hypothetical protein